MAFLCFRTKERTRLCGRLKPSSLSCRIRSKVRSKVQRTRLRRRRKTKRCLSANSSYNNCDGLMWKINFLLYRFFIFKSESQILLNVSLFLKINQVPRCVCVSLVIWIIFSTVINVNSHQSSFFCVHMNVRYLYEDPQLCITLVWVVENHTRENVTANKHVFICFLWAQNRRNCKDQLFRNVWLTI